VVNPIDFADILCTFLLTKILTSKHTILGAQNQHVFTGCLKFLFQLLMSYAENKWL